NAQEVYAENVTDRYTRGKQQAELKPAGGKSKPLTEGQRHQVFEAAKGYFDAPAAEQAGYKFPADPDGLGRSSEEDVRQTVWRAYAGSKLHAELKADFEKKQVRNGPHLSAYTVKQVGKKPAAGWPLVIAMHGGGNTPKSVNDSQWKIMQG